MCIRGSITYLFFVFTVPSPQLSIKTEGMPIADTMFTATCIAEFYPGVPLQAVQMEWISVNLNSELINFPPRLLYGDTSQINATHFQRTITVDPLQVIDTGNYICRVGVDGEYVYTRVDTNLTVELIVNGKLMWLNWYKAYNIFHYFSFVYVCGSAYGCELGREQQLSPI